MPDDLKTLKLTETEINLVLDTLHAFEPDGTGWEQVDLNELADDLREQLHRHDDGWGDSVNHDLHIAETQMFNAGVDAREKMKATSRAAGRRALKFRVGTAEDDRSEMQGVDVWDPNDPKNW